MKAAKKLIRILIIFFTSTWGVFFGLLAPFIAKSDGEFLPEGYAYVFNIWIIMAILGYFVPCFLVMLDFYKTAAIFSAAGTVLALIIHGILEPLANAGEDSGSGASFMYLPQIFITILTIIYIFVMRNMREDKEDKKVKRNEKAPSILDERQ